MKTLHKLGSCCMIPNIDYMRLAWPSKKVCEVVCKWCSKASGMDDNSGSNTSSSTEDEKTV